MEDWLTRKSIHLLFWSACDISIFINFLWRVDIVRVLKEILQELRNYNRRLLFISNELFKEFEDYLKVRPTDYYWVNRGFLFLLYVLLLGHWYLLQEIILKLYRLEPTIDTHGADRLG